MTTHGSAPTLYSETYTSFDGNMFPYQKWLPSSREVRLVVIGFHGIAGASDDFRNLALHLQKYHPSVALYAPDQRGQGKDPVRPRRGDLHHPSEWFHDAHTFTRLVRCHHPEARIIWCGESMGSLIALHGLHHYPQEPLPCDALILASPVVHIPPHRISPSRRFLLRLTAAALPRARLSLETLSGERNTRLTQGSVHQKQVETNSWHVSHFTLRLLRHLESLIQAMPEQASKTTLPVLIIHGGKDAFSTSDEIAAFAKEFPSKTSIIRNFYPASHHLLFYDHEKERVLKDTGKWLHDFLEP